MRNVFKFISISFLILAGLILNINFAKAANEHSIVSKSGPAIAQSTSLSIQDQWYSYMSTNGLNNSIFNVSQAYTSIGLRFDQSKLNNYQSKWSLDVNYSIELFALSSSGTITTTTQTGLLKIDYDNATTYKDKDLVKFASNYFKAKLTIGVVTYKNAAGTPTAIPSTFSNDFFIDLEQETERYYKFSTSPNAPFVYASAVTTTNELPVAWNYVQGAESYDVEWIFIDLGKDVFTINFDFDFRNATRINTKNQYYKIPLGYPKGILIYRVRGVGYDLLSSIRTESEWSYNNNSLLGNTVNTPSNPNLAYRLDYDGLDQNKNWQYSASFAEDGKRKEIISYFDGSLRNRQTATKLNSDNNVILAETKYDYEGRGVVQMLPTPMGNIGIQYNSSFNNNFDKSDFDADATYLIPNVVNPTNNATATYYSSNSSAIGIDAYTPDAQGYPYSRATFKRDGTGRVSTQSGVGIDFKTGSGHETQYFYGTPTGQQELDRLFGNEVGNWMHYKKNLVVDPNGQASVTYLDQEGRTIATALSGDEPTNLLAIDGKPAPISLTSDLLTGKNNLINNELTALSTIVVSTASSTYNFSYNLNDSLYCENCDETPICKTCKYDLIFTVKDEDNVPVSYTTSNGAATGTVVFQNISAETNFTFYVTFDYVGTYTVIKTLKLNETSLTEYYDDLVSQYYNCLPYTDIQPEPCLDCQGICEKRFKIPDGNGGYTYVDEQGDLITGQNAAAEAQVLIDQCKAFCENPSSSLKDECELHKEILKADMSPGGQYFDNYYYNPTTNEFNIVLDSNNNPINDNTWLEAHIPTTGAATQFGSFLSWINNNPQNGGCYFPSSVTDTWTTWDDIRSNWKDCFADFLIYYHPEYCQYQFNCERDLCPSIEQGHWTPNGGITIVESNDFDLAMQQNFALHEYYIPTALSSYTTVSTTDNSGYIGTNSITLPTQNTDPYFDLNTYTNCSSENNFGISNSCTNNNAIEERKAVNDLLKYYMAAGTSGTPVWLSVWYVLDDPSNIHSATSLSAAITAAGFTMPNSVYQTIRNIHGDGTSAHPGILGGTYPTMTKYEYFVNIYLGIKKLIQFQRYNNLYNIQTPGTSPAPAGISCETPLASSTTHWGWTNGATSSFQIRYLKNIVFDTYWANACYNSATSPQLTVPNSMITNWQNVLNGTTPNAVLTEAYKGNCGQYVDQWMTSIYAACSGLENGLTPTQKDAMKQYLIDVCASDADLIHAQGGDGTRNGNVIAGPVNFDTFQDVIDYYISLPTSPSLSCTPSAPVHPSASIINQQVDCMCENYNQFIIDNGLSSATDAVKASTISSFYGTTVSATDIATWATECAATPPHTLNNLLNYNLPEALQCPASNLQNYNSNNCTCTNLNNYIAAMDISSPSNTEIATSLTDDFGTTITAGEVADWLTACSTSTYTSGTFSNLPSALKCLSQDECTKNTIYSFIINHGFPIPPSNYPTINYSSIQQTAIVASLNAAFQPTVALVWSDVDAWLVACTANSYSSTTFSNLPNGLRCSESGLPPPSCACEQENLQAAEEANYFNTQNRLLLAQQAALAYLESYKTLCLNTISRETFKVIYTLNEYYYTLYYYDQAGNLLKTVPPNGVQPLTTTTEFNNVTAYRAAASGSTFTVPSHKMVTHYWYNSLQQLVKQNTPDADLSTFYYDALGRLVVSQNAKQDLIDNYSYTVYDVLGRITNVGEIHSTVTMTNAIARNKDLTTTLASWITAGTKSQIAATYYDETMSGAPSAVSAIQENLRNRVTSTTYDADGTAPYDNATHYSYDIHGNVKILIQENKKLSLTSQQLKRIDYDYDLISGKVNKVSYQAGQADQFYHQYYYDADNRLTNVYTSRDNTIWDQDAKYFFYATGALSRAEIGDKKVQGIDYANTIQGWQKNINSETLDPTRDMGQDGNITSNLNKSIGRDAFAYTLGYFEGDYVPKNTSTANALAAVTGSELLSNRFDLFNGNISYMVTNLTDPTTGNFLPNGMAYKYDQLNRIKEARGFTNINNSTNAWQNGSTYAGRYYNGYTFDMNGNIQTALVKNSTGTVIDDQTYNYELLSGNRINNRLIDITDAATATGTYDLLTQSTNNYSYTKIGELKTDALDGITDIKRRIDGKITEIDRATGTKKNLKFDYDANGNRIAKHVYSNANVWEKSEYYVLDASGNIMSTYKHEGTGGSESFKQIEKHIYGSSLLGIASEEKELIGATVSTTNFSRTLGNKNYTGNNHLGNDLVIFTDKKIEYDNNTDGTIDYFTANLTSAKDYGVYGEYLTNRVFTPDAFPNSFNGKRDDEELKGWQNYGYRNYLKGRRGFDRVDPLTAEYPWNSPFCFAENDVIRCIDLDGLEKFSIIDGTAEFFDPATGKVESIPAKRLVLLKTDAALEVIDENGVSSTSFKYCEFACQTRGLRVETQISGVEGSKRLVTPNLKQDDKYNVESTFNITIVDFKKAAFIPDNGYSVHLLEDIAGRTNENGNETLTKLDLINVGFGRLADDYKSQETPDANEYDFGSSLKKFNTINILNGTNFTQEEILNELSETGGIDVSKFTILYNETTTKSKTGVLNVEFGNIDCPDCK
ncbi:MAG: hypothetical protein A3F72_01890 [Bacteroidetes bacterium RIFCSPLOWO2_12_FULL_35_15]|nr:MAG: hypothetical protein A3F72_01890 [Bacteroidetes bacterium RIFCSPLOWO2_12_FULL_35_15]